MDIGFHIKYVLFLSDFNFLNMFQKDSPISNFMKIHPVGAMLFNANGREDMTKLTAAFRNFVNAPKSENIHFCTNHVYAYMGPNTRIWQNLDFYMFYYICQYNTFSVLYTTTELLKCMHGRG
jgi:hypothetical protein